MASDFDRWIRSCPPGVVFEEPGTGRACTVDLDGAALREAILWAAKQAMDNDRGMFAWRLGSGKPVLTARKMGG